LSWVAIVKASLNVKDEGGNLKAKSLEEAYFMSEGGSSVLYGEARAGPGVVRAE